jgi:hypothetical protein
MSFALRSTAAAALLALGAVGTAHAVATASAEIGQVTITLIDLDPLDGITPMLTFLSEQSSSYASVYDGGTSTGDSDWAAGFYMPTSATAIDVVGWGTGSTGAGGAQGAAEIAGSPTAGVYSQTSGQGYFYGNFELTPWTGLILTTNYAAQADTSVGWVANDQTEYAGGYTQLSLEIVQSDGFDQHYASRNAFASYTWDGSQYVGFSDSASGQLRLTYANFSGDAQSGSYSATAYAYAQSSIAAAIPEPGTYGLLLAGLAGIGAVVRRRRG